MAASDSLRRTRLIGWSIGIAAVLVVGGWLSAELWVGFVARLLG